MTKGKQLRQFSIETRLKSSNEFKEKVLKLFKNYIKSIIVWGSITRGDYTGKSDVDIYVIFDDTIMSIQKFDSIRDRVYDDLTKIAKEVDPRLHPQPAIALTEFWDGIRTCHPLYYNIVREGYAVFDTGFFIPMRKMLEWGKFPATTEAAQVRMAGVPKRIKRVKSVKALMVAEDLYQAVIDSVQAVLMYIGVAPPVPKLAATEVRKHLVTNGLIEEKYAAFVEKMMKFRKDIEHKEISDEISGKDVDEWIKETEEFVDRIEKLIVTLDKEKKKMDIKKSYEIMVKATVAALQSLNKLPKEPEKLPAAFKEHLVDKGIVNPIYFDVFDKMMYMRKKVEENKLEDIKERDVEMSKEYVRRFVIDLRKLLEKTPQIPKEMIISDKLEESKQFIQTAKSIEKERPIEEGVCQTDKKTEERLEKLEKKVARSKKQSSV